MFRLPELSYGFDVLEPYIDAKTMNIHYNGHHSAYVNNLNSAIEKCPYLKGKLLIELLLDLESLPEDIKIVVRNNGGGHYNHTFWWSQLKKSASFNSEGELFKDLVNQFGGFESFKAEFKKVALDRFGSGWAWAIYEHRQKILYSTSNQDNPIMERRLPFLGLDVWEHAYYLKYQNKRGEYIDNFWNVVDWNEVERRYLMVKSGKQPLIL
ncbi:MAG: superoxide dismutase [Fervidobacterium sp.]